MCGFVAILGRAGRGELARMAEAVAVRGPDDRGEFSEAPFQAIHHRLAIVGADARGRQPMTVDGITVLFNGCIYNYPQLRRELETEGVRFVSDSDTEILPHLYRRHGTAMFSMLNGMFAIALWVARDRRLVLARDPAGEKPLFLCSQGGRIGVASTLSAFERGDWRLTPQVAAVADLLSTMRIEAPRTLYREVQQLPAGCYAEVDEDGGVRRTRYHDPVDPAAPNAVWLREPTPAALEARLDRAFRMRTLSDKPLAVFLSGGVDSSLIAASLAEAGGADRLRTFAVRFAGGAGDYDESAHAAEVARHLGCDHQLLEVTPDAEETLDAMAAAFDQPVANSAALPTFLISEAARRHVGVALSGIGGDELFGGYPRYLGLLWHGRLRGLPGHRALRALLERLGDSDSGRNLRGRLRRFLSGLHDAPADAYLRWMRTCEASAAAMLTQPVERQEAEAWPTAAEEAGGLAALLRRLGPVNGAMAFDQCAYLSDDLLPVADRMSMAHALELRAPFLDRDLMREALWLAPRYKVAGVPWQEGLKLLLRATARRRLPARIVDRPKQGFMAPVKLWLRGALRPAMEDLAARAPAGGLIRQTFVQGQWQRHLAGEDRADILWAILLLDRWAAQRGWRF